MEECKLEQRVDILEKNDEKQTKLLDSTNVLVKEIHSALIGNKSFGIVGIAQLTAEAHSKIAELKRDTESANYQVNEKVKALAATVEKEKWMSRLGGGVVGAVSAGVIMWAKKTFFGN